MSRRAHVLLAAMAGMLIAAVSAAAQTPAEFYKGRTLSLMIGFGPGGANDVWARTIAGHLGRHLPGNPTVIVQNVPGAGGLALVNQLANVSPRDGTVIGLINRGIPLEPLLGGQGIQFDPMKLNWIGSPDKDITICVARKDAAVQKMQDLYDKELVVGATGSGADTAVYPEFLAALLGMKFKTVKGYKGSNEILLAMERGEVQGICVANNSVMRTQMAKEGRINVLLQAALKPDPRLKGVPVAADIARTAEERQALELFFARVALGRPFVAPPGLPADRLAALRKGFADALKDPALIEEAKKQGLTVDAMTGDELGEVLARVYRTPAAIVKRTAEALGRAGKDSNKK